MIVGEEGKGKEDVFSTIYELERGATEVKGISMKYQEWNPAVDGPRMS